ncbi:replication protein A 70 kDa DNA-binding subunit B [Tanacetum coccineum]
MEQQMTPLCDINPMLDDVKVLGNRIQAPMKGKDLMNKFMAGLDEGSCYRIRNFKVGENRGKYPLLNHRYKINFYKNTSITRVNHFDQNLRGFKFKPFQNFKTKHFGPTDLVDVIGTIVSISNRIPFESYGKEKYRRTVILQDVDGHQLECCFYENWAEKFNGVATNEMESTEPVVMILQLAKISLGSNQNTKQPAEQVSIHQNTEQPEENKSQ